MLAFSRQISWLVLALWTCSGLVFPVAVAWNPQITEDGPGFYIHFFMSLALCGFAATAYPYFLITSGLVTYFLPAMIRNGTIAGPRRSDLERVKVINRIHMAMAACVPFLGILMMVIFQNKDDYYLSVVCIGGLLGVVATAWLWRRIELDALALSHLAIDERRSPDRALQSRQREQQTPIERKAQLTRRRTAPHFTTEMVGTRDTNTSCGRPRLAVATGCGRRTCSTPGRSGRRPTRGGRRPESESAAGGR